MITLFIVWLHFIGCHQSLDRHHNVNGDVKLYVWLLKIYMQLATATASSYIVSYTGVARYGYIAIASNLATYLSEDPLASCFRKLSLECISLACVRHYSVVLKSN